MRRVLAAVAFAPCLLLLTGCFQNGAQHQLKLREARQGLDPAVAQVRQFPDFDVITVKYYENYDDEHGPGPTCYYSRAYLLVGTSLPLPDALDQYARQFQSLEWRFQGRQYQDSRKLVRGASERAVFDTNGPGPELKDAADYGELRRTYRSLIYVNIDHILPAVASC